MIQLEAMFLSSIKCNRPDNKRKDIACLIFWCFFPSLVVFLSFHGKFSEFMYFFFEVRKSTSFLQRTLLLFWARINSVWRKVDDSTNYSFPSSLWSHSVVEILSLQWREEHRKPGVQGNGRKERPLYSTKWYKCLINICHKLADFLLHFWKFLWHKWN